MSTQEPTQEAEATEASSADDLSEEVARKYDPERLLKLVSKRAGRGQSLDYALRSKYEKRFGVDLGHVRVYTGEFAEVFNKQRNAHAVTIGQTGMILMGGSPDRSMATAAGQALLAHELTHVAQARRGLYASGRSDARVFAQEIEDAEAEAEEMEAMVAAEEAGAAGLAGPMAGPGMDRTHDAERQAEEDKAGVIARVFEMLSESMQMGEMRSGRPARR